MKQFRANQENPNLLLLQHPPACGRQQRCFELLKTIAKGDQQALASLYQETRPPLFGFILRIIANRPLAEEILLEVYKQVYQQAVAYDLRRGEPLVWMLNLARAHALACLRSRTYENEFQHPVFQEALLSELPIEPENASVFATRQKLARAALASLSTIQCEVIELAYYGGLSVDEIASRLEISQDTVQRQTRLAMMGLREILRPVLQEQL